MGEITSERNRVTSVYPRSPSDDRPTMVSFIIMLLSSSLSDDLPCGVTTFPLIHYYFYRRNCNGNLESKLGSSIFFVTYLHFIIRDLFRGNIQDPFSYVNTIEALYIHFRDSYVFNANGCRLEAESTISSIAHPLSSNFFLFHYFSLLLSRHLLCVIIIPCLFGVSVEQLPRLCAP